MPKVPKKRGRPRKPLIISILKKNEHIFDTNSNTSDSSIEAEDSERVTLDAKLYVPTPVKFLKDGNRVNCQFCGKSLKNKTIAFKIHKRKCPKQSRTGGGDQNSNRKLDLSCLDENPDQSNCSENFECFRNLKEVGNHQPSEPEDFEFFEGSENPEIFQKSENSGQFEHVIDVDQTDDKSVEINENAVEFEDEIEIQDNFIHVKIENQNNNEVAIEDSEMKILYGCPLCIVKNPVKEDIVNHIDTFHRISKAMQLKWGFTISETNV